MVLVSAVFFFFLECMSMQLKRSSWSINSIHDERFGIEFGIWLGIAWIINYAHVMHLQTLHIVLNAWEILTRAGIALSLSFSYCQHRNNPAILLKIPIEMFIVTMMCSLDVYYVRCIAPTSPLLQCSECLSIFSCLSNPLPPSQPFNMHEKFAIEWRGKTSSCAF